MSARIKRGDTVEVLKGRHRGSRGQVLRIDGERGRVVVQRVNLVKRHQKANQQNRQGGIVEKEAPLDLSNVMLVHKGERTRVAFKTVGERKVRWSKRHDEAIDG